MRLWFAPTIGVMLATITIAVGQQKTPVHSWDVLMNQPDAETAAAKLLGRCGDAQTQDVMNACFALEFKREDGRLNIAYKALMKTLDKGSAQHVRVAQRAWLQYRNLHCEAVGEIQTGGGSLEPTEILSCKTDLTKARIKEMRTSYEAPH